jgi:hypothetical protein
MTAFAALTFAVFTCGFFIGAAVLAGWHSEHALVGYFTRPYARGGRRWRWLWAVPHRFARKLWFALLIAAWPFSDTERAASLALLVFASLLVLLALALWLRPYADARDNQLEVACLLLLLYGYFVSVLPGSSSAMDASVSALQLALLVYGAQRWLRHRLAKAPPAAGVTSGGGGGRTSSEAGESAPCDRGDEPLASSRSRPAAGQYRDSWSASELAVPLMPLGHGQQAAAAAAEDNEGRAVGLEDAQSDAV